MSEQLPPPNPNESLGADFESAAANFKVAQKPETQAPADQMAKEMALTEAYKGSDMEPVITENLNILKRFDGMWVPQYKNPQLVSENLPEEELSPEFTEDIGGGHVEFGATLEPRAMVSLTLQSPLKMSQEEFNGLNESDKRKASIEHTGINVLGDYPEHTEKMLDEIYDLIGAEKLRDDTDEPAGELQGTKVYKGKYGSTEVYIVEDWNTFDGGTDRYTIRGVSVFGPEIGNLALYGLSQSDLDKLASHGVTPIQARQDGVDRRNMESYIANIGEINNLAAPENR